MPLETLGNSSTNSSTRSKSRQAAQQAAQTALLAGTNLPLQTRAVGNPNQDGRQRLKGAFEIDIDQIEAEPQVRTTFDQQQIDERAASIEESGFKNPISVRWDTNKQKYIIISGECRFRAAQKIQLQRIPCWVRDIHDPEAILIDQLIENWQRADLHPYETADALVRLRTEFNYTPKQMAKATGKSDAEVSKLLALVDKVDPEVQQEVRQLPDVSLTQRHLYNLSMLPLEKQGSMVRKIQREHLTATEIEAIVRQTKEDRTLTKPTHRYRYKASSGHVVVTIHKEDPSGTDVIDALQTAIKYAKDEFGE